MNLYESFLKDITKCVNEWNSWSNRSWGHPDYISNSYKGKTYMCEAEVNAVMKYFIKRWDSTVEWCNKAGLSRNVENIFWRNLQSYYQSRAETIFKAIGLTHWRGLLDYSDPEKQKELYSLYESSAKAKIDEIAAEEDRQKEEENKREEERRAFYEEWLADNDWTYDLDSLSYKELETKYDEVLELYKEGDKKNKYFSELLKRIEACKDRIMSTVPTEDFGTINGWSQLTQDRFSALINKLKSRGYTDEKSGRSMGRCWDLKILIWYDAEGNPVYVVKYDVDSSD